MNRLSRASAALELDGEHLTLADAGRILDGDVVRLTLAPAARRRVEAARACLVELWPAATPSTASTPASAS